MATTDTLARMLGVCLDIDVSLEEPTLTPSQILACRVGNPIAPQKRVGEQPRVFSSNTQVGFGDIPALQDRVPVRMTRLAGRLR